jgi:hemoglobin
MTKTEVLLERLGGQKALRAAVDEFYLRLTGDKELARFFEGVNVKLLKWHQVRLDE